MASPALLFSIQGLVALRSCAARLSHAAERFGDLFDGLEVGLHAHLADVTAGEMERPEARAALSGFRRNVLHFALHPQHPMNASTLAAVVELCNRWYGRGGFGQASFHLDLEPWFTILRREIDPGMELLFENLDSRSEAGNSLPEVVAAAAGHAAWGVVLDLAHVMELRPTGGESPQVFVEALGDRIGEYHFSWPGHVYPEAMLPRDFRAMHSFASLVPAEAARAYAGLPFGRADAVTIEGVVPEGDRGEALLRAEVDFLRENFFGPED